MTKRLQQTICHKTHIIKNKNKKINQDKKIISAEIFKITNIIQIGDLFLTKQKLNTNEIYKGNEYKKINKKQTQSTT